MKKIRALVLVTGWLGEKKNFFLSKYATKVSFTLSRAPHSAFFIKNSISCFLKTFNVLPVIRNYDVLLSMGTMNSLTYSFICKFVQQVRIPHVMVDIATPRFVGKSVFRRSFIRLFLSSVDRIVCDVSSKVIFWSRYMGFPSNKVIFIPEAIDPSLYRPNFLGKGDYLISVGRAARDYKTLFSAIRNLNIKLIVVMGADPFQSNVERKLFHSKIQHPFPNVTILREVPPQLTKKLIADSRFVVLSLSSDVPFGSGGITVLLESMAMGKAVIATRVHHTIDYIENFKTGILSEPNNPADLRNKIIYLLENPSEIERIGKNARKAIEERFNERRYALDIENVLIDTINDR
jgi:glycosyltransferase involved in cell wall biosynthesis